MSDERPYDWTDIKVAVTFMLVMSLSFTLCYVANQWWLFPIIMALYVIRAGINQYSDNKVHKVKMEMSNAWKVMIAASFLFQLAQITVIMIVLGSFIELPMPEGGLVEVYGRIDSMDGFDKALGTIEWLNESLPLMINECCKGGEFN